MMLTIEQSAKTLDKDSGKKAHLDFARDMAAIYGSLSERQQRLSDEFETAIFDDLVSLYES